jgi:hypothetical protein
MAEENIDTFVVGIPGSEAYEEFLNEFAVAGKRRAGDGDYDYYRVESVDDLTQVMRDITVALVRSCAIEVENPSGQTRAPELAINCERIQRLEGGGGSDSGGEMENWTWDADTNTVEVQGDLCTEIETEGVERVDVIFNCGGIY